VGNLTFRTQKIVTVMMIMMAVIKKSVHNQLKIWFNKQCKKNRQYTTYQPPYKRLTTLLPL